MAELRPDRADRARRRRRSVVAASVVVLASVVLGLGALIASDVLRLGGGPGPALAERASPPSTSTQDDSDDRCRAQLGPAHPLRLWIAGDSLAGSLGPALGERAAATGIVQPVYDARVSSGLSSPEFFDWPEHATAEMARLDPEVVVFIVGANDWRTPSRDPSWEDEYASVVEEMLAVLEDEGTRHVYWVGSPTMQERRKDDGVQQVNAVASDVIAQHERVTYVDAYELFSDDDGGYAASLPGPQGRDVRVRTGDGIHLTAAGAERLADAVYDDLESRCELAEQAVPDQPKTVLRTRGSDGPAGSDAGSGSGSSGGSTPGSTAATTVPPVSAAPVPPPETPTTPTTQAEPITDPTDPPSGPEGGAEQPTTDVEP